MEDIKNFDTIEEAFDKIFGDNYERVKCNRCEKDVDIRDTCGNMCVDCFYEEMVA